MNGYHNIVVGIDDSETSMAALIETAHWVRVHGGRIILVHVIYFDEEEFGLAYEMFEKRADAGREICNRVRSTIENDFEITVETLIKEGEPPEVLADVAWHSGADLIAMGTHRRRGVNRLLLGSVTSEVIPKAPCDVLVVKRPCEKCTGEYHSLLVAYDGSEFSRNALQHAEKLVSPRDGALSVLYVIPRHEEMIDFFKTESIKKHLRKEADKLLAPVGERLQDSGLQGDLIVEEGSPEDKIVETAGRLNTDLIVIGSHGWTGLDRALMGSTTTRVIMGAPCPILVVR